jgi:DNA-binding HxlR family transcriptional regulator
VIATAELVARRLPQSPGMEILWRLNQRVHRFGELRRALPDITQPMLTAKLRELEVDGLVSRTVFAQVPPRVDYAITESARASVNL